MTTIADAIAERRKERMTSRIFVFQSNLAGRHGAGTARAARRLHGAVPGVSEGRQGNAYAIPTKDERFNPLPVATVEAYVARFLDYARANSHLRFYVTATGVDPLCHRNEAIAPMFREAPENCSLPRSWALYLSREAMKT